MSSFWDSQKEIMSVEKNKREKVIVSECSRQDKSYIDIRVNAKNSEDNFVPTGKGIALEKSMALDLFSSILKEFN